MSLHESEIISFIEAKTGYQCYLDVVPNKKTLPALALTNVSYGSLNSRVLSGKKTGSTSEHRISLITNTPAELDLLVNSVELLDNTSNDYFQRITVDLSSREPRQIGNNVVRAFYNLTVTKK